LKGRRPARRRSAVEDDRHGPVVRDLDAHAGTEGAAGDPDALVRERGAEGLVERLGPLGRGRVREARAVALRQVGDERELADDERPASGVEDAAVELSFLVLEDPEPGDLRRQALRGRLVVAARDAEEDAESRADLADRLARDEDARLGDPLDDRPQLSSASRARR
jgi:hypothetical protein